MRRTITIELEVDEYRLLRSALNAQVLKLQSQQPSAFPDEDELKVRATRRVGQKIGQAYHEAA